MKQKVALKDKKFKIQVNGRFIGINSADEGHAVAWLIAALCYKPEGRGFYS
jgi:hypothetical protein